MVTSAAKTQYRINRRTKKNKGGGDLSSFALDIRISFDCKGEGTFLDDLNGDPLAFNTIHEMKALLDAEIDRNYVEHFGHAVPSA